MGNIAAYDPEAEAVQDMSAEVARLNALNTALTSERDAIRFELERTQAGVADINRQNEELRGINKNLGEYCQAKEQERAEQVQMTPRFPPGAHLLREPTLFVDLNGSGFWVNPADRVLQRAW